MPLILRPDFGKLGITSQNPKRIPVVPPTSSTFWRLNGHPVDLSKLKADGSQFTGRESNVAPELLAAGHPPARETKMDPPDVGSRGTSAMMF